MLISKKYGFLFIHVPKTAGTALAIELSGYCGVKSWLAYKGMQIKGLRKAVLSATKGEPIEVLTGFDAHASYLTLKRDLGADLVQGLYSFSVIRNPFVRALSVYEHIRRVETHPAHTIASQNSFHEALPELLAIGWFHQSFLITDPEHEKISVRKMIPYERLNEGLKDLSDNLKLPKPITLKSVNAHQHGPRDIAENFGEHVDHFVEFLAADFRLLGYSTDPAKAFDPPERLH